MNEKKTFLQTFLRHTNVIKFMQFWIKINFSWALFSLYAVCVCLGWEKKFIFKLKVSINCNRFWRYTIEQKKKLLFSFPKKSLLCVKTTNFKFLQKTILRSHARHIKEEEMKTIEKEKWKVKLFNLIYAHGWTNLIFFFTFFVVHEEASMSL